MELIDNWLILHDQELRPEGELPSGQRWVHRACDEGGFLLEMTTQNSNEIQFWLVFHAHISVTFDKQIMQHCKCELY